MAKVAADSLPWLSSPSTGYDLFTKPSSFVPRDGDNNTFGPKRLIATRGAEIFVGRGNEVRCADLNDLKARHPDINVQAEAAKKLGHREYKVLNLPQIDFEIRQLEISRDELFLAIVGEKEIAVCVLPGEGFLKRPQPRPVVPHYYKIGMGYHNVDNGALIVKALWHPLGVEGASLVVLTADGYVRTYDFMLGNDITFEVPDQTLDLYALCGRKRQTGYMADVDEMAPASCCFGSGESGWRPFTLYILMRSGDVYALNPVVPSRWMASRAYIQMLSMEITEELDAFTEETSTEHRTMIRHQTKWINDVLNQESLITESQMTLSTPRGNTPTCLKRPTVVGPEPLLQGPFLFEPAPEETATEGIPAACDIFHLDTDTVSVIGIVSSDGKLDINIEPEVLPARWVDRKRPVIPLSSEELPTIACYETIDLKLKAGPESEYTSWPTFTKDPHTAQLYFVNHISGVLAFSMKPWLSKLDYLLEEAADDENALALALSRAPGSQVQTIVNTSGSAVDGSCVVYEAYIGYLLLAGHSNGLASVEFDEPLSPGNFGLGDETSDIITLQPPTRFSSGYSTPRSSRYPADFPTSPSGFKTSTSTPPVKKVSILQPPFQPSPAFEKKSQLPEFLKQQKNANKPIMFSAETLNAFKTARATLKTEFDTLMSGAQEMHDRAAAQRLEYNKQLESIAAIHSRLGALRAKNLPTRLKTFIERQEAMQKRADGLLRTMIIQGELGLSDAEKKWKKEVEKVSERVVNEDGNSLAARAIGVTHLVGELLVGDEDQEEEEQREDDGVPKEVREGKLKMLNELIEREDELVTKTRKRLENLELETERF
ncbi:hypothetical protein FPQ18DRAFT_329475 [Pyronema domesticum]|uniref:Similar to Nucleoporin nup82 acc. no. Q9P382 n=1 Tax=Pyronema omphalodes (strain CBS 100304) TaxID=1076935 RepID=U4LVZ3_PYROM|nr:hypothetical protein FPQ18DRAFT_329475 [Pyronema domesticum]CCX32986.1 Similar to Nucleoporin nup82; acc. no. Q9P382 [Pyronema omphalodes CBS 100304]